MIYKFSCQLNSSEYQTSKNIESRLNRTLDVLTKVENKVFELILVLSYRRQTVQMAYITMANRLGCSERAVRYAVQKLAAMNLLTKIRGAWKVSNIYKISMFLYDKDIRKIISEKYQFLGKSVYSTIDLLWSKIKAMTQSGNRRNCRLLNINENISNEITTTYNCLNINKRLNIKRAREDLSKNINLGTKDDKVALSFHKGKREMNETRAEILQAMGIDGFQSFKFVGFSDEILKYARDCMSKKKEIENKTAYALTMCKIGYEKLKNNMPLVQETKAPGQYKAVAVKKPESSYQRFIKSAQTYTPPQETKINLDEELVKAQRMVKYAESADNIFATISANARLKSVLEQIAERDKIQTRMT